MEKETKNKLILALISGFIGVVITSCISLWIHFDEIARTERTIAREFNEYFDFVDRELDFKSMLKILHDDLKNTKEENSRLENQLLESENSNAVINELSITDAKENAANNDFAKAIGILRDLKNSAESESLLQDYIPKYEAQIRQKVDTLKSEAKFDDALVAITDAQKILPQSKTLDLMRQEVESSYPKNFMDVCEPYESQGYNKYTSGETFLMSGVKRTNGFTIGGWGGFAISNLSGKYAELNFDVGHVDGTSMFDGPLQIYLDGVLYETYEIKADGIVSNLTVPIQGKQQIKFVFPDAYNAMGYRADCGLSNMTIK